MWVQSSITEGELDALRVSAERAWADDTRYPLASSDRSDRGQCYVTSCWLVSRLGGKVGRKEGHFVWLSPDERWVIDLTDHHRGQGYGRYLQQRPGEEYRRASFIDGPRVQRFIKRADRIFDNLDRILKLGLDYAGDALPAEEPQATEDRDQQYWHDEPAHEPETTTYKFVYGNGQLEISPFHEHGDLADHAGLGPDHMGPMVVGFVNVINGRATWEAQTNINIKALERIFKDYCKQVGWQWGGITNVEGEPISDEFAPKKSQVLNFVYDGGSDHLWLSAHSAGDVVTRLAGLDEGHQGEMVAGELRIDSRRCLLFVSSGHPTPAAIETCFLFCKDRGLTLYAGNDNRLHTQPDLELDNIYDPSPDQPQDSQFFNEHDDPDQPMGILQCPICNALLPNWYEYQDHRRTQHGEKDQEAINDGGFPEMEESAIQDTHFTPQQPEVLPTASVHAARVDGFRGGEEGDSYFVAFHYGSPIGYACIRQDKMVDLHVVREEAKQPILAKVRRYTQKEPKDLLDSPIPFIFDIDQDKIKVGQPGSRTSDIPGTFTPGGIIEGTYEPGGKVMIRTMTNTPYSVRHMISLWYYEHPELTVKSMYMQDEAGGTTKLADNQSVGGYVASLAASDPTVSTVARALQSAGGRVHVVGGAVRDVVMGKEPKDLDLMVTGLAPDRIHDALKQLPGRSDLTGKDFGVFRYRDRDGDVEIALPRRERSTGAGHQDFDVQADPHMTPAEDFYRRDFTANAMGVDLQNGKMIDPYNGVKDIREGRLRMVNPDAFSDDPLRIVRGLGAHSRHGFYPDKETRNQMSVNAPTLQSIAPERIQAELDRLFAGDNPAGAIRLAHATGTLPYILPEVENTFGYDQNNPHHELELGEHSLNVLDRASKGTQDPDVRLAALLHDIGKPSSGWIDPETGSNHYYEGRLADGTPVGANHEEVGSEMARAAMNRLRYPTDRTNRVSQLVQHHMWPAFTTQKGARRFLNRVGDHANDLFTIREADQGGKRYPTIGDAPEPPNLDQQRQLVNQVQQEGQPINRSQLAVNGQDLINAGIPQGPEIGRVLGILENAVIDNPQLNTQPMLLTLAKQNARI